MTTPAQLAASLGVTTGDRIGSPERKMTPEDHDTARARWGVWEREIFKQLRPSALFLSGAKCFVSVTVHNDDGTQTKFGHNRPQRPVRLGITRQWPDRVTPTDNRNPYFWQGLLMRVWTPSEMHSKKLAFVVAEALTPMSEPTELLNKFIALSADVALDQVEREIHITAWARGIPTWDDAGLSGAIFDARKTCNVTADQPMNVLKAVDQIVGRALRAVERRNREITR